MGGSPLVTEGPGADFDRSPLATVVPGAVLAGREGAPLAAEVPGAELRGSVGTGGGRDGEVLDGGLDGGGTFLRACFGRTETRESLFPSKVLPSSLLMICCWV